MQLQKVPDVLNTWGAVGVITALFTIHTQRVSRQQLREKMRLNGVRTRELFSELEEYNLVNHTRIPGDVLTLTTRGEEVLTLFMDLEGILWNT